ncbi:MAG: pentapeptide repeat-containing protein [Bradymonadaceae bacterium]|nr:pentapeptide repeat-containing protein [Lujinxingiaceae bacterium]
MLGLRFNDCNRFLFSIVLKDCYLKMASFFRMKLPKIVIEGCNLQDADFTETNLTTATFSNCDLAMATFDNTILEGADLRTAYNYTIDPERNRLKKAKFSQSGLGGLLSKYQIVID